MVELDVRKDGARAEVALVAEDRVTDVVEVRHLRAVEEQAVLEFARVAEDRAVADEDVLAHVAPVADVAVGPDPGRAFDHRAVFDHRAFADEHVRADVGLADQFALEPGPQAELQVSRDFVEDFPNVRHVLEQDAVRGTLEVKVIGGREGRGHGESESELRRA